jgi:hypothetical protein
MSWKGFCKFASGEDAAILKKKKPQIDIDITSIY